jgi:hypothetical protein
LDARRLAEYAHGHDVACLGHEGGVHPVRSARKNREFLLLNQFFTEGFYRLFPKLGELGFLESNRLFQLKDAYHRGKCRPIDIRVDALRGDHLDLSGK